MTRTRTSLRGRGSAAQLVALPSTFESAIAAAAPRSVRNGPDRPVTAKIPRSMLDVLSAFVLVDGGTLAEHLRMALSRYITMRLDDPDLKDRIQEAKSRFGRSLAPLMTGTPDEASKGPTVKPFHDESIPVDDAEQVSLRIDQRTFDLLSSISTLDADSSMADQLRFATRYYTEVKRREETNLDQRVDAALQRQQDLLNTLRSSS